MAFARLQNIEYKQMFFSGAGAFFALVIQSAVAEATGNSFLATLVSAMFIQAYSEWMARINRAPATIFLTSSMLALTPGFNLYIMMYGITKGNMDIAKINGLKCLTTVAAIAIGFIAMGIVNRYVRYIIHGIRRVRNGVRQKLDGSSAGAGRSRREENRYDWDVDAGTGVWNGSDKPEK